MNGLLSAMCSAKKSARRRRSTIMFSAYSEATSCMSACVQASGDSSASRRVLLNTLMSLSISSRGVYTTRVYRDEAVLGHRLG